MAFADTWRDSLDQRFAVFGLHVPSRLDQQSRRQLEALLSEQERERYRSMPSVVKQEEFLLGRALLRRVLGTLLDCPPATVRLSLTNYGKLLLDMPGAPHLSFNLSHADGYILTAVGSHAAIGIDIESIGEYHAAIARRFFFPDEYSWLEQLAPEQRAAAFTQLWTIKEACVKAIGVGIQGLRMIHVGSGATGSSNDVCWSLVPVNAKVKAAVAFRPWPDQPAPQTARIYLIELAELLAEASM